MRLFLRFLDELDGQGQSIGQRGIKSWLQVEKAVGRLDGVRRSAVIVCYGLRATELGERFWVAPLVSFGGGNGGRCFVYTTDDNETFVSLDGGDPGPQVDLNLAGQSGDVPSVRAVGVDQALRATKSFIETGKLDLSFVWSRD